MPFVQVVVRFQFTRGLSKVAYAADLSRRLGVPLVLAVPGCAADEPDRYLIRVFDCLGDQVPASLAAAVRDGTVSVIPDSWTLGDPDTVNVGPSLEASAAGNRLLNYLSPGDEDAVAATDAVPEILVPFGGLDTACRIRPAIDLAAALHARICLYHTTWRNERFGDAPPIEHVSHGAQEAMAIITSSCWAAGVQFSTVVEFARDVTRGIIRKALERGSNLIAVTRGEQAIRGSYVDQLLELSTVPVLVLGPKEASK